MRAKGDSGELRVGYQCAAHLGSWTLEAVTASTPTFVLRAEVIDKHDYWSTQGPLDLALMLGRHTEWVWRHVVNTPLGDSVKVTLSERPIVTERTIHEQQGETTWQVSG